ncbi:hypothetical protein BP5796_04243 [Coleophoma crateriformis]|uniref:Uncharacterized protein n=1 Tax=Coleophoma crateriformis TaxID=565419 RepID=A0A3D8SJG5_9HELO|nr:hypothetical protein BP5796_04243 [Coleophoma crateriformis]
MAPYSLAAHSPITAPTLAHPKAIPYDNTRGYVVSKVLDGSLQATVAAHTGLDVEGLGESAAHSKVLGIWNDASEGTVLDVGADDQTCTEHPAVGRLKEAHWAVTIRHKNGIHGDIADQDTAQRPE